jgi:hypothetical protein
LNTQASACEILASCQQHSAGKGLAISLALAAAQKKLERLRLAYRPNQPQKQQSTVVRVGRFNSPDSAPHSVATYETRPKTIPAHLGWNSAAVTTAYRLALRNQTRLKQKAETPSSQTEPSLSPPQPKVTIHKKQYIRLSPDIALAILRKKLAAPARIWLLLRHLDETGQGWISAEDARYHLAGQQSPTAVCGKRQLRNLLSAGDNIFWERDDARIWLKSLAKVALALDLTRLNGRPVRLPLSILLKSIGTVRAHFYATFHSSRNGRNDQVGRTTGKPISRQTLKTLSSATRKTQRLYEKKVGVHQKTNYAVGSCYSIEAAQDLAWKQGRAFFHFQDKKGYIGKSGQKYLAWQIPNSYNGPHDISSRGHQRRINRQLADLLNEGITGNGEAGGDEVVGGSEDRMRRPIFYRNGSKAARDYNRSPERDYYWRSRIGSGRYRLWHILPAVDQKKNGR